AQFTIPIDVIVAAFFVLIALMFVGLGQVLGRAFDAYPNRVIGYTLNIGGSLVGIVFFLLLSLLPAPPLAWFLVSCARVAFLLRQKGALTWLRLLALAALLGVIIVPSAYERLYGKNETTWSPYYSVEFQPNVRTINVNNIGHQRMVPFDATGSEYSLIHL